LIHFFSLAIPTLKFPSLPRGQTVKLLLTNIIATVLLLTIFLWNIDTLKEPHERKLTGSFLETLLFSLNLDQNWSLFAPAPYQDDGWFVIPGTFRDGTTQNILPGNKNTLITYEKPLNV